MFVYKNKKMTKKEREKKIEKLFKELHFAEEERDHLEHDVIPTIVSELQALKLTKKEIKESGINQHPEWLD